MRALDFTLVAWLTLALPFSSWAEFDCLPGPPEMDAAYPIDQIQHTQGQAKRIPRRPSAPPKLGSAKIVKPFGCDRAYSYRGKTYAADSYNARDGERLRPVIKRVPEAVENLNSYQSNRRKVKIAAYAGTIGLATWLTGLMVGRISNNAAGDRVRQIGTIAGVGIMAGSAIFSIAILAPNETYLNSAVDSFNKANKPEDRIELKFSTGLF